MPAKAPVHRPPASSAPRHVPPMVDRQQRRALHTGVAAWKRQRARVLARDLYLCAHCGGYGDHVDHINGDASRHVQDTALQTLCRSCHSVKTAREQGGFGNPR